MASTFLMKVRMTCSTAWSKALMPIALAMRHGMRWRPSAMPRSNQARHSPRPLPRCWPAFGRNWKLLQEFPHLGTRTGDERRAYPLTGFPYSLIYRHINTDIRILVVRHQSRDPSYGELRS